MSRFLVSGFGALVLGALFWGVFGWIAAVLGSRQPGGDREGAAAMGGFFFIGPIFGIAGLLLGFWLVYRLTADPTRIGTAALTIFGVLAVFGIGVFLALRPVRVERDDFPGKRASLQVEVSFPAEVATGFQPSDRLEFELRSGDGTEVTPGLLPQTRREGGRVVVPGAFPIRELPRTKLLAVMKNDQQLMSSTLTVEGEFETGTGWSAWQELEAGIQARWRLTITSR